MQGKLMFAAGAALGYVFGTRTGRQGYERLKQQATELWQSPRVQQTVADVQGFAREKGPAVGEKLSGAGRRIAEAIPGRRSSESGSGMGSSFDTDSEYATPMPSTSTMGSTANDV